MYGLQINYNYNYNYITVFTASGTCYPLLLSAAIVGELELA